MLNTLLIQKKKTTNADSAKKNQESQAVGITEYSGYVCLISEE